MTSLRAEGESYSLFDKSFYQQQINTMTQPIIRKFERVMRSYMLFHILFFTIAIVEIVLIVCLFTFLVQSSLFAISISILFLTVFTYFILKIYLQTKKPEQFKEIVDSYLTECKKHLDYHEGIPEHHLMLADTCCRLVEACQGREYLFPIIRFLSFLTPSLEKWNCWWYWQDYHILKEMVLLAAIQEHIKLVKNEPTNLEAHAGLASAYVMLSQLYVDPRKFVEEGDERWLPRGCYASEMMEEKFRATSKKAIEEFKILSDYAPNDPWVHLQLAYSYHDLQMPAEEIKEYEIILKLNPDDKEALYKLGILYFQLGRNAAGLEVYEELKRSNYKKAESLISFYGS